MTGAKPWSWPLGIKTEDVCSFSASQCMVYKRFSQPCSENRWSATAPPLPPSASLPSSPFALQVKGRVPSTLNWQETTQTFYHLRTSSISRWSRCWQGATAVITYGAFSPIFLRPRFFFFFFCTIALFNGSFSKSQKLGTGVLPGILGKGTLVRV